MSIKKNFFYNSVLTVSNYIFPFITFPYVSRVLGVSNIGICNFVDSIINYFILFSMMGISTVGIREIAKHKENPKKLEHIFSSLFFLTAISTVIMLVLLVAATFLVPELYVHKNLMLIGAAKLIFNLFLTEWFFIGTENFKFITVRSVIVKFVFVAFIFVFVRKAEDYQIYYVLLAVTVVLNAVLNHFYRIKWVKFNIGSINYKPYLNSFLMLGVYLILTSMYTYFNVTYLGFVATTTDVGYYTTATKLYAIFLSLFTALTAVMIPRISALIEKNDLNEIKRLTSISYDALIAFCLPIIIICSVFAPQIIEIIAGKGYEGAITPFRMIMPMMLFVGFAQILVLQLLLPLKKDRAILINSLVGAIIGIGLNIMLVKSYKSAGAAFALICSEISVTIMAQYFVGKEIGIKFPLKSLLTNIFYLLPILLICSLFQWYFDLPDFLSFAWASAISLTYLFVLHLFFVRNVLVLSAINMTPLIRIGWVDIVVNKKRT